MSQFAHDRPEEWLAIGGLPPREQNRALRAAMDVPTFTADGDHRCDVCGAPPGKHHLSYCDLRGEA